jgi:peptidoglycan-N-acetylglucosamine deacetylase
VRLASAIGAGIATIGVGYWTGFAPTSQLFGRFPYRRVTDQRVVALSFDDGPNEPYTTNLLRVLEQRQVRATFFQVGRCVERFPSTSRSVLTAGHVLGNHSYNHRFSNYFTEPSQRSEITRTQHVLADACGVMPGLYRPPWLCHWPWVLSSINGSGMQVASGQFGHPLEIFQPPGPAMARAAARLVHPGSILIFHDGVEARGGRRDQTVAAVGPLIDSLTEDGYSFVTVDELLGVAPYLH